MFTVKIFEKKTGIEKEVPLTKITENSTGYEYGIHLAYAISDQIRDKKASVVSVFHDDMLIHKLMIVPKGGTIMVTENGFDTVPLQFDFKENTEKLKERYLIMVDPEKNHNKFYRMVDLGNRKWGAFYGRVGESQGESVYSNHINKPYEYNDYMYGIKLWEKLVKGYKDKTECHVDKNNESSVKERTYSDIADKFVADLIKKLMEFANETISKNYTVGAESVTAAMITEAKKEIEKLKKVKTVKVFNKHLLELMHIIPRRIDGYGAFGVKSMMSDKTEDFEDIITREENLLDIMEGQVNISQNNHDDKKDDEEKDLLKAMNLEIRLANDGEISEVRKNLPDDLRSKLKNVYRITNTVTQKRFNELVKREHCAVTKLLWHGSKNENWIHILQQGLLLRPNAAITGKMFGQGIYFAPSAKKSWGYTSYMGSYWAKGTSNTAYMGLYETAYGKPFEVYDTHLFYGGFNKSDLKRYAPGCGCVHAKADRGMLRNDEIIFYDESCMTIKYLCEFGV